MIDYIKEFCKINSMRKLPYDEDADTWDLEFDTSENNYFPYETEGVPVCLPFESKEESEKIYNEVTELINKEL